MKTVLQLLVALPADVLAGPVLLCLPAVRRCRRRAGPPPRLRRCGRPSGRHQGLPAGQALPGRLRSLRDGLREALPLREPGGDGHGPG